MLTSGHQIPSSLWLRNPLDEMNVRPSVLLALFDRDRNVLNAEVTGGVREEFQMLWSVIHSPLTPDTLEGIWRAGLSLGTRVPAPDEIQLAVFRSLAGAKVAKRRSKPLLRFWRSKSRVYECQINRPDVVRWESSWAAAILRLFAGIGIGKSLELDEATIVARVLANTMTEEDGHELFRYKPPRRYFLSDDHRRRESLIADLPMDDLPRVFRSVVDASYDAGQTPRTSPA